MGLILPRWGLILHRIPPLTLVLYSAVTNLCWGCVCKTFPTSSQNIPFPGLNLEVGKMNYHLGNWTPTGQNVWKVDKTFQEVGKKILFIWSLEYLNKRLPPISVADCLTFGQPNTLQLHSLSIRATIEFKTWFELYEGFETIQQVVLFSS